MRDFNEAGARPAEAGQGGIPVADDGDNVILAGGRSPLNLGSL